jgi:osmotically-inducible protein OsmY
MTAISPSLVELVEQALARNPETAQAGVDVTEESAGIINLSGAVPTGELRKAVEQVAEAQEGVIDVVNDIEVDPSAGKDPAQYAIPRKLVQG